ncbi:acyl-CoA ligase (AMP-forming), exosortase A system-associated [Microlunatus capsulatus]|uniref:Acyl-CoA ligase (AMP-forming) (Exosortase A-associated) n=1 Tax=Microlunatus capsulatus TaxID=99117 RepID=A0ABS4ZBW2_9ACTN|nr:acyl-CoA ligase (AMP-forming), exosortase A system-associated [Microlunatus capsulatus]MBP2418554.1 acyl-CoA ligase (AMP-forming) (exosortase A-associated) [Microlunatus capsulatus]
MRTNLHHLLEQAAHRRPDAPCLTHRTRTATYADVWSAVQRVAAGLQGLGLQRGDRVAVFVDKRVETVVALFATSAAGGVVVPVNHVLKAAQATYILGNCGVRVLVTTRERLALVREALDDLPALEQVVLVDESADQDDLRPGRGFAVHLWADLQGADAPLVPPPAVDVDVAAIFYTSGSTGRPKGVVLSHRNLLVGAESVSSYLANTADDVILSALPLSFDAGFSQVTTAFAVGAHVVLHNHLVAADIVKLVAAHRVTGLTGVPPLWLQVVSAAWPEGAGASLRYFANTGGRMPKSTLERLRALFPAAQPFLMYGLTEAFRSTYLDPAEVDRRPDSIGKAIPNAEILVVRPDGTRCGPGEEGELVHRGALVGLGYWDDPVKTAERFKPVPGEAAAWRTPEVAVWSGDHVVADEEGFLYFVGRTDDMIKTSGYRVSPTEVEEVAYDTGLVRDAVALGVEDERLGQRIVLVATPVNGDELRPDQLVAAFRKQLPLYMVPSTVLVREELPRSPNGKYDRSLIRAELTA